MDFASVTRKPNQKKDEFHSCPPPASFIQNDVGDETHTIDTIDTFFFWLTFEKIKIFFKKREILCLYLHNQID